MKSLLLLILSVPLLAFGQQNMNQTDAQGKKQGWWQKKYPNGKIMYQGNFRDDKPVGEWKRYHDSGSVKAILDYDTKSDSVKARLFENSGKPVAEGFYISEKKIGTWNYYSDGVIIAKENFQEGRKTGISYKFYPTGQLLEESEWKDDQLNGKYRAFFTSGKPYLECIYQAGQRNGFCISYYQSGAVEVEAYYEKDLPDREWKYFDKEGNIRYVLNYTRGTLTNPEVIQKMDTRQLDDLEKQRGRLIDPEKYLQNPEEYMLKKP
jgi:antitoxin component YwqK of YwqJK toxin-antitoxin module